MRTLQRQATSSQRSDGFDWFTRSVLVQYERVTHDTNLLWRVETIDRHCPTGPTHAVQAAAFPALPTVMTTSRKHPTERRPTDKTASAFCKRGSCHSRVQARTSLALVCRFPSRAMASFRSFLRHVDGFCLAFRRLFLLLLHCLLLLLDCLLLLLDKHLLGLVRLGGNFLLGLGHLFLFLARTTLPFLGVWATPKEKHQSDGPAVDFCPMRHVGSRRQNTK